MAAAPTLLPERPDHQAIGHVIPTQFSSATPVGLLAGRDGGAQFHAAVPGAGVQHRGGRHGAEYDDPVTPARPSPAGWT